MLLSETKLRSIVRSEIARSNSNSHSTRTILEVFADDSLAARSDARIAARTSQKAAPADLTPPAPPLFSIDSRGLPVMDKSVAREMESWFAPVDDSVLWSIASIFDPSALMSWPQFYRSWARYSQTPSTANAVLMMLNLLGCVPLLGSALKSTRFVTTGLRSARVLSTAGNVDNLGKLKAIGRAFAESGTKWSELVEELGPHADQLAQTVKSAVPASALTGAELMKSLRSAAGVIDRYNNHLKYISYVASNAGSSVQQFLLGRFGPKSVKTIDIATASAALPVAKAAGQLPVIAANAPQIVARAAAQVIPPEWQTYVSKSARWGKSSEQSAVAVRDYFIKNNRTYNQFVAWYNRTRNDAKIMASLGKSAGQHITFEEIRKLLRI